MHEKSPPPAFRSLITGNRTSFVLHDYGEEECALSECDFHFALLFPFHLCTTPLLTWLLTRAFLFI